MMLSSVSTVNFKRLDGGLTPLSNASMSVQERIKAAIAAKKLTQTSVETAAKLSRGTLSNFLKRGGRGGVETLEKLARTMGVSYRWLSTGEGSMDDAEDAEDRYPSRAGAIAGWRAQGLDASAIASVAHENMKLDHDPGAEFWRERFAFWKRENALAKKIDETPVDEMFGAPAEPREPPVKQLPTVPPVKPRR